MAKCRCCRDDKDSHHSDMMTSYEADLIGNIFRCTVYPVSFVDVAFIFLVLEDQNKLGLNRINCKSEHQRNHHVFPNV